MGPRLLLSSLLVATTLLVPTEHPAPASAPTAAAVGQLQFVPNFGQWDAQVRFGVLGDTLGWLTDDGFTLQLERWSDGGHATRPTPRTRSGGVVRTRFLGARTAGFTTAGPLATQHNFFVGDAARWRTRVPAVATVTMQRVWAGIDVRFRALDGDRRGPFEYDLELAAGADLGAFAARCEGVAGLRIDDAGRLCAAVQTPDGEQELRQEAPIAWQHTAEGRRPLAVRFRLIDDITYGFAASDLDPALAATIDPGVVWGTFLGGGASDRIEAMRWVPGTGVWVAGWAGSTDFPTTPGAYRTTGGADAFVARLSNDGESLVFATYLGGNGGEEARGLGLGPGNTPTVVGFTRSTDFPVTPSAAQGSYHGGSIYIDIGDAFVTRLGAAGDTLLGSTYLGGVYDDVAEAVYVEPTGAAVVVGWTMSPDFPTTAGAYQPTLAPPGLITSDGFVTRVSADGQTIGASTFLGGTASDQLTAIDRDPVTSGYAVCGFAGSTNFPTTQTALRATLAGGNDAVVARLDANFTALQASTYLGGLSDEAALAVRVDTAGRFWVGGHTNSTNFPKTNGAVQVTFGGNIDGFVSQLSADASTLLYSTYLGGSGNDKVRGLAVSGLGTFVVGEAGEGLPVTVDALQSSFAGGNLDGFASLIAPGGAALTWSTYLGGPGQDTLRAVELAPSGLAVIAGWSYSTAFPIGPAAYQDQLLGVQDGVVLQLDLLDSIGAGLTVSGAGSTTVSVVVPGDHELLAVALDNTSLREIEVEKLRLFVGGAGDATSNVTSLRVYRDRTGGPELVAGPLSLSGDDGITEVELDDVELDPGEHAVLRVFGVLQGVGEIAAAVLDDDGWHLHAEGAGGGPQVRVVTPGRVEGPVLVLGGLPGDVDLDGQRSVVDLRRAIVEPGSVSLADIDGDGLLSAIDAFALRQALLGRASVLQQTEGVARGGVLEFTGIFPVLESVQAALGGRALLLGRATPRQLTFVVDGAQPPGTQELVVTIAGKTIATGLVTVW